MSNICKVVILGENAVGKTCIVNRYISGTFRETVVSAGASFDSKTIFFEEYGRSIKFEIWDTGEDHRRYNVHKQFYKDASACIFVYDISRKDTFDQLKKYGINTVKKNLNVDSCNLIFNNKIFCKYSVCNCGKQM